MTKKYDSLIGNLFEWYHKKFNAKQDLFLQRLFPYEFQVVRNDAKGNLIKSDQLPAKKVQGFSKPESYSAIMSQIKQFATSIFGYEDEVSACMVKALKTVDWQNQKIAECLISYISTANGRNRFAKALYAYLYLAVTRRLPEMVVYEQYENFEADLEEYRDEVLMKVGSSGTPGIMTIFNMANRKSPNVIALYEAGEMEYYGRGLTGVRNFNNAYAYYRKAVTEIRYHPLAAWSIGYILYKYQKPGGDLENAFIRDIDLLDTDDRYRLAIRYLQESEERSCAAAANVLGSIVCDTNVKEHLKKGLKTAKEYLSFSADAGYMYGKNQYAMYLLQEAGESGTQEKVALYREHVRYLKESAEMGEPWAANKIALYYYHGLHIGETCIIHPNAEKAFDYFKTSSHAGRDKKRYWATYNLINLFYGDSGSNHFNEIGAEEQAASLEAMLDTKDIVLRGKIISLLELQYGKRDTSMTSKHVVDSDREIKKKN